MKDPAFLLAQMEISPFGPPNLPGVYAVCVFNPYIKKERILYIGSAKDIRKRVTHENHPYYIVFRKFNSWPVCTKSIITDDYKEIEKQLIKFVKPLMNVQHKKD